MAENNMSREGQIASGQNPDRGGPFKFGRRRLLPLEPIPSAPVQPEPELKEEPEVVIGQENIDSFQAHLQEAQEARMPRHVEIQQDKGVQRREYLEPKVEQSKKPKTYTRRAVIGGGLVATAAGGGFLLKDKIRKFFGFTVFAPGAESNPTERPATQLPATQEPATQVPTEVPATQAPATEVPAIVEPTKVPEKYPYTLTQAVDLGTGNKLYLTKEVQERESPIESISVNTADFPNAPELIKAGVLKNLHTLWRSGVDAVEGEEVTLEEFTRRYEAGEKLETTIPGLDGPFATQKSDLTFDIHSLNYVYVPFGTPQVLGALGANSGHGLRRIGGEGGQIFGEILSKKPNRNSPAMDIARHTTVMSDAEVRVIDAPQLNVSQLSRLATELDRLARGDLAPVMTLTDPNNVLVGYSAINTTLVTP